MNERVHPFVRSVASQHDADAVSARERDDKTQHRVEFHFDTDDRVQYEDVKIAAFTRERADITTSDPSVTIEDGVCKVSFAVFVPHGVTAKNFTHLNFGGGSSGVERTNWSGEHFRDDPAPA